VALMREADNLAALIDDADAWADQFCSSLPGAAGIETGAPIADKARGYRDLLYCRFADQAFSASRSARHGRPASTSSLILSAFETFTHLFELRDHLDLAFARGSLDALDALLTERLFGDPSVDASDATTLAKGDGFSLDLGDPGEGWDDEAGLDGADSPARLAAIGLPIADNDGPGGPTPDDSPPVDPGACVADDRADLALRRLMRTLIAIETSFDNSYRALEGSLARLDAMFGR
jgi:hypothetical protein